MAEQQEEKSNQVEIYYADSIYFSFLCHNKKVEGSREVKKEPYGQQYCFAPDSHSLNHHEMSLVKQIEIFLPRTLMGNWFAFAWQGSGSSRGAAGVAPLKLPWLRVAPTSGQGQDHQRRW